MPFAPPLPSRPWSHVLDPRSSFTARTVLVVGAAALLLVVVIAGLSGALLRRQLERRTGAAFENSALQVADKIDRAIYERYRQLQTAATLPALRNPAAPPIERQAILESLHEASPDYAWIGLVDAQGTVVAASQHFFEGETATRYPWFSGARRGPFVGTVHEHRALAELLPRVGAEPPPRTGAEAPRFLDLAVPVTGATNQFLGVLAAEVRWTLAREVQLSVIADAARQEHLGVTIYAATGEMLFDSDGSGWTGPPDPPAGLPTRIGARGSLTEYTSGGTVYLTGYARTKGFREYRGLGWLVAVRQPVARVFAPVQELRTSLLLYGACFAAALAAGGGIVAARLERRFRAIALASERIGDGDVGTLMPRAKGDSDFARMCAALDTMVEKFRRQG